MKRNAKVGIALAVLFVVGMAYQNRTKTFIARTAAVGAAVGPVAAVTAPRRMARRHNRREDYRNNNYDKDNGSGAGAALLGTAAVLGTAGAIAASRDDD